MKHLTAFCSAFLLMTAMAFSQAQIEVTNDVHDFGRIAQGVPVTNDFIIKNVGTEPLIISNVQTSCGCTAPSWPKEPIMPGQTGKVSAQYNAAAMGKFNKSITVVSNATTTHYRLSVAGEVVKKSDLDGAPANKSSLTPNQ